MGLEAIGGTIINEPLVIEPAAQDNKPREGNLKEWYAQLLVAPVDPIEGGTGEPLLGNFLHSRLQGYDAVVQTEERQLNLSLWIDATSAIAAAGIAEKLFIDAHSAAKLEVPIKSLPAIVDLRVTRRDEVESELGRSRFPALMGVKEVADLLGVRSSRVSELARYCETFPKPVARLAAGPVWAETTLLSFVDGWHRRPGPAPRKSEPKNDGHSPEDKQTLTAAKNADQGDSKFPATNWTMPMRSRRDKGDRKAHRSK